MIRFGNKRRRRDTFGQSLIIIFLLPLIYYLLNHDHHSVNEHVDPEVHLGRRLLQANESSEKNITLVNGTNLVKEYEFEDPLFPDDLFSTEQLKSGAVVLHIIGVIYMFYALALICDEYFVPSLDVITEKLQISPDVAGATFMAAGGSAPELFSSIIGVFIAKSDVGIGTIVGSAVFNILFVIAACAFAAKEALSLTAWPLIRDVFFYSISLILLVFFFRDNRILWWEALILFLWYFSYVGFMKFNEATEDCLRKLFKLQKVEHRVRGFTIRGAHNRKGLYHLMNETINPGLLKNKQSDGKQVQGEEGVPLRENTGIAMGENGPKPGGLTQLKSHLRDSEGGRPESETGAESNSQIQFDNSNNEAKDAELQDVSNEQTPTNSCLTPKIGPAGDGSVETGKDADADASKQEENVDEPIDLSFPRGQGCKQITIYLVTIPIMFPLSLTLPDTKDPKKRKFFVITFIGSIIWIAIFSYFMVWWATVAGNVIGIPPAVMGLTFLAAGTSVPDLITSVLVAKQGKGDMAVSSSVGSNIFDITVGLPFPWLLYVIFIDSHIDVNSTGLGCQVLLLFLMLITVFLCILSFKWRMTKAMGVMMLLLYATFVAVSLGFSYDLYSCPI